MARITVYGNIVKDVVSVQKSIYSGEPFFTRDIVTEHRLEDGELLNKDDVTIHLGFDQGAEMYLAQWGLKPRGYQPGETEFDIATDAYFEAVNSEVEPAGDDIEF